MNELARVARQQAIELCAWNLPRMEEEHQALRANVMLLTDHLDQLEAERDAYREAIKAHRALLEGIESPATDADNELYAVLDRYPEAEEPGVRA